jgi:hypothetical protein
LKPGSVPAGSLDLRNCFHYLAGRRIYQLLDKFENQSAAIQRSIDFTA